MRKSCLPILFLLPVLISPASMIAFASQGQPKPQLYVPPRIVQTPPTGFASGFACPTVPGASSSDCSPNWSGYAVTSADGSVSAVQGSWVVPAVTCPASEQTFASLWVGIDGYNSNTVEQTGTDSDCQSGSPTYYAWYEFYPSVSVTVSSVNVAPGDIITASVTYSGTTGDFTISISSSGGGSNSASQPVPGAQRNSAEWVVERPEICLNQGCSLYTLTTLADFGSASLGFDYTGSSSSNYATVGATNGPISLFPDVAITMQSDSGPVLAEPGSLTTDGTSFVVDSSGTFLQPLCTSQSVVVGLSIKCRVTVAGISPTGKVTWSSSGSGKFTTTTCRLYRGACSVKYTPAAAGPATITASYPGDTLNTSSIGIFSLTVTQKASRTAFSCSTTSARVGKTIKCTAAVTGYKRSGTVTWSQSSSDGGSVTFTSSFTCTLVKGHCSVTMTGTSAGTVTIHATYNGDLNNIASSKTRNLTIRPTI